MPLDELYFHAEHLWCRKSPDGLLRVGISDFAQASLGEVVYLDLPDVGARIQQGVSMGTVESIKVVNDLIAPVSGEVLEVNPAIADNPSLPNSEPYGAGWLITVAPEGDAEFVGLLDEAAYLASIGG